MNTTPESLLALIQQGENSAIEFKSSDVHPDSLAREIVAMANGQGGDILIGVEDDGAISGLSFEYKRTINTWLEWAANIARENVIPALNVACESVVLNDVPVLHLRVPKGIDKPYQTSKHQFLIRVGSTNRVATQTELMRLFQQSGVFHFDATGVDGTNIQSLNIYKLAGHFGKYNVDVHAESDLPRLLQNIDVLTADGRATVAGLLVFGIEPQRYLQNASISFARFAGDTVTAPLIDKQLMEGNLDVQIDTALALVKNHIPQPSIIQGARTVLTNPGYPDEVFRELLVNACVHRNYAIHGSRIRVQMFTDRIEFLSPGRLPNTITIEKVAHGVSYAVNPVIVKFMENMRYIDKLGRGLPTVVQAAKALGRVAVFEEIGEEFKVTLPL
jgi:ATP-dependent DNA helicase RecG